MENNHKEAILLKIWIKRGTIGLFLLSALLITLHTELVQQLRLGNVDYISEVIGENKGYILFITFLIMFIHNAFPIIPLVLVITINNTLLGIQLGFIWGVFTSVVCAVGVFVSLRFGFQCMIINRMNESILERIENRGFWYVLVTRIFPFAPTSVINSIAAVSNIHLSVYIVSTIIGNVIIFLLYTVLYSGIVSQSISFNEYMITGVLTIGIFILYGIKKYRKRKL